MDRVSIGEVCQNQVQCPTGAVCKDSVCSCPTGLANVDGVCKPLCNEETEIEVKGQCFKKAVPGEACEMDEQCQHLSSCDTDTQLCVCPPEMDVVADHCVKKLSRPMSTCPIPGQVNQAVFSSQHTIILRPHTSSQEPPTYDSAIQLSLRAQEVEQLLLGKI